jgi:hypothetical protein
MRSLVSLVCILLLGVSSAAQTKPAAESDGARKEAVNLWLQVKTLEAKAMLYALDPDGNKDSAGAAEELAGAYQKALSYAGSGANFAGEIYAEFLASKAAANSAPQVSQVANEASVKLQFLLAAQNQVLIDQNKKIIDLLGQIARKK